MFDCPQTLRTTVKNDPEKLLLPVCSIIFCKVWNTIVWL